MDVPLDLQLVMTSVRAGASCLERSFNKATFHEQAALSGERRRIQDISEVATWSVSMTARFSPCSYLKQAGDVFV